MLIVETIARIRREHFLKGKTIKEIARDLKVSRNTVRKVLRSGVTVLEYEREVQPRPKPFDSIQVRPVSNVAATRITSRKTMTALPRTSTRQSGSIRQAVLMR